MQTDSLDEVRSRDAIKATEVPMMQFQGADEFLDNGKDIAVSDQPYFGTYNLFRNEVEDLYPGSELQDPETRRNALLEDHSGYKLLKLKDSARFSRFALIPDSAHFHIIENPQACAAAIHDFIFSVNEAPDGETA